MLNVIGEYQTLECIADSLIATITIARPEKLNALSSAVLDDLRHLVTDLRMRDDIGVVIITGKGEKAFVAGADIAELASLNDLEAGREYALKGQSVFSLIESSPKPFIAAVNGFALGGGCELALACHIRICSDNAAFGQPEVNLGIIPGYGGTQRLTRVLGRTLATDLILTGRQMNAREALEQGMVSKVVPQANLIEAALQIAQAIASKAPLAISAALDCIVEGIDESIDEGLGREAERFGQLTTSSDFHEGTSAFLQKRKPTFTGA
ncbi:MAG TPA: enoyl-CoA hydratase-related protein [Candidatus Kapabacteria bacterium]|nr:enoyl-CoA hydratase-related protein [Candidatus Kapabacteria bacterium]